MDHVRVLRVSTLYRCVCQDILAVAIEQQILVKFISVYIRKGNVQLINMVNIGKEKSAGRKKMTSTQKEKRSS